MSDPALTDLIAVDTGVWLEGLLFGGSAEELVRMAVAEQIRLVTCEALILELETILRRRLAFSEAAAQAVVEFVRDCAEVRPDPGPAAGALDRRALLLNVAERSGADAIFTTDRSRLHRLGRSSSVPVVSIV
ncbi:MAG: PIN domain-containing protein [Planctomycetota bacterium]